MFGMAEALASFSNTLTMIFYVLVVIAACSLLRAAGTLISMLPAILWSVAAYLVILFIGVSMGVDVFFNVQDVTGISMSLVKFILPLGLGLVAAEALRGSRITSTVIPACIIIALLFM